MLKIFHILLIITLFGCSDSDNNNSIEQQIQLTAGINEIPIEQNIDGSNVLRNVFIRTPENIDYSISYPVVLFFHGAGGSGQDFLYNEFIVNLINQGEFIGVFPNGYSTHSGSGGFWNLGSEPTNADDVFFVDLIMQQLSLIDVTETNQSYAVGFSNGAGMVNLLGKQTNYFRAIAPLFSQQLSSIGELSPLQELSILQLNGDIDHIVPLAGGISPVGSFMSAEDSALNWVAHFECDTPSTYENIIWGSVNLDCYSYVNCLDNHEVKYMIGQSIGHGWNDLEADELLYNYIWNFFKQH